MLKLFTMKLFTKGWVQVQQDGWQGQRLEDDVCKREGSRGARAITGVIVTIFHTKDVRPKTRRHILGQHTLRRWLRLFLCVFVLLLGLANQNVIAQTNVSTEELERDIATYQRSLAAREREQAEIDAALGDLATDLTAQIAERDRIGSELVNLRRDRQALEGELAALESQVAANETRITELEGRLEVLEGRLQSLLIALHRQRSNRYAQMLADSDSFFELRVRNHYLSELANQDVSILEDIRTTVRQLADAQTQLAEQVNARSTTLTELQATEARLATSQAQLEQVISDLEASQAGQLALRQDIIQQQNSLEATITGARQALTSERERLAREAAAARRRAREAAESQRSELLDEAEQTEAAAAALAVPTRPLEDGYTLPFPNPQLSKRYGEEGPYVFLRAEQDYTAVRAVKSGVVQIVQPVQANTGYLVVIAHDSELLSAYQNLQAPQLEIGDWVNQGDIIGYLGGGTLIPADTLKFFIGLSQAGGGAAWVDPELRLGFAQ
jgi:septal ring factor EnvC (AmiA/AmiB activator)